MSTPKCHYFRNDFCFICAENVPIGKRFKINDKLKACYKFCFEIDLVTDTFTPGILCSGCKNKITYAKNQQTIKNVRFSTPAQWSKPLDPQHSDCYFCLYKQNKTPVESTSLIKPIFKKMAIEKTIRQPRKSEKFYSIVDRLRKKRRPIGRRTKLVDRMIEDDDEFICSVNPKDYANTNRIIIERQASGRTRIRINDDDDCDGDDNDNVDGNGDGNDNNDNVDDTDEDQNYCDSFFDTSIEEETDSADELENRVYLDNNNKLVRDVSTLTNNYTKVCVSKMSEDKICDCPVLNMSLFNFMVANPRIYDQRSLDEFAINMKLIQPNDEDFIVFKFERRKLIKEDCQIRICRINDRFIQVTPDVKENLDEYIETLKKNNKLKYAEDSSFECNQTNTTQQLNETEDQDSMSDNYEDRLTIDEDIVQSSDDLKSNDKSNESLEDKLCLSTMESSSQTANWRNVVVSSNEQMTISECQLSSIAIREHDYQLVSDVRVGVKRKISQITTNSDGEKNVQDICNNQKKHVQDVCDDNKDKNLEQINNDDDQKKDDQNICNDQKKNDQDICNDNNDQNLEQIKNDDDQKKQIQDICNDDKNPNEEHNNLKESMKEILNFDSDQKCDSHQQNDENSDVQSITTSATSAQSHQSKAIVQIS